MDTPPADPGRGGPLDGIRVVEIGSAIAGPYVGKILADHGARVTKVEPLWGANFRNRPLHYDTHGNDEFTYRFLMYNTGKHSVSLDLKTPEGREILWALLERADVVVENMRAGTFARLGFAWEEMHDHNPGLVYCSVTGYGEAGPYVDLPAYDATIQGVSSWVEFIGELDEPEKTALLAIDHSTALTATTGILMALLERGISGEGQRVDVAMLDVAVSYLGHQLAEYSGATADESVEPYYWKQEPGGVYRVDDGLISLNIMPERWAAFCRAIDREEFTEPDHRYATVGGRIKHARALRQEIETALEGGTAAEWITRFREEDPRIAVGPANQFPGLLDDPHVTSQDLVLERDHPDLGRYWIPRPPHRFSRTPAQLREAPGLGEHTIPVLRDLGYTADEIHDLLDRGIIHAPEDQATREPGEGNT